MDEVLLDVSDLINKGIAWGAMYKSLESLNKEKDRGIKTSDLIKIMDMTISDIRKTMEELGA